MLNADGPRIFGWETKVNVSFPPPKQPGFVGVCQSCQEEAPVGETRFTPEGRFCVFGRRKKVTGTFGDGSFLGFLKFQLSNHQFEELAMDVYDEVDRRETDAGGTPMDVCRHPLLMPRI